jgi:hypothetical protein
MTESTAANGTRAAGADDRLASAHLYALQYLLREVQSFGQAPASPNVNGHRHLRVVPEGLREELDEIVIRIQATATRDLERVVSMLRHHGF